MTYTADVLGGLALELHNAEVGTYQASGTYPVGTLRPIYLGDLPSVSGEAIAVVPYLDVPGVLGSADLYVQIRTRGTTNMLEGLAVTDLIQGLFHRRTHVALGGHRFNLISQRSFSRLSPDGNGRYQFTQNFQLTGIRGNRI